MEDIDNTENNKSDITDNQKGNRPWLFKKGQSGNPKGRPKGKGMKEYTREMLAAMTEEEREEFLHGLPKEVIWKMAEGNPATDTPGQSLDLPFIVKIIKDGKDG